MYLLFLVAPSSANASCLVSESSTAQSSLPEHPRLPLVFGGVRVVYSLVFYVVSCNIVCLFVFFIFRHGVVSLFSIYEFDCLFGIFRPSLRILIAFHVPSFAFSPSFPLEVLMGVYFSLLFPVPSPPFKAYNGYHYHQHGLLTKKVKDILVADNSFHHCMF